jgi:hypothetical protein
MPFWVPIAIAAIAAAVAICLFLLGDRPQHAMLKAEASAKFRSAFFAESIADLDNKDAYALMHQARTQHDAAIIEFRPFVHPNQIKHFDVAEQKFHRCRSELQPKPLKILAAIRSNKPVDHSDTDELKEALTRLLAFADKT